MDSSYSGDSPITQPDEDKFGRGPFANRIAEALAKRSESTSIVVGVYGAWGEGKTSVLNLIDGALTKHQGIKTLRFNPWRYQDEDQLLIAFFEALVDSLGEKLYNWVERNSKRKVATVLRKGVAWIPGVGEANEAIDYLTAVDIEKLKDRVEKKLAQAKTRIVVLVDDIDRLDKSEVFAVFRLVKLTASFQNVSFILAFDDKVVSDALQERYSHSSHESGKAFLEKIIQIPLELPQVQPTVLRNYCLMGIENALNASAHEPSQEEIHRFLAAFDAGLAPVIQTPRDVVRYHNALAFTLPILKGDLNVVDLMLLEGIRVFYPALYEAMRTDKDTFLSDRRMHESTEAGRNRMKEKYESLFKGSTGTKREAQEELVGHLFPSLKGVASGWPEHVDHKRISLDQRVASSRYYDRYFILNIPEGDISDSRIDAIVSKAIDPTTAPDQLKEAVSKVLHEANSELVIHKLNLRDEELGPVGARALSIAVAQSGNAIPKTTSFFGLDGPRRQAAWMISNLLDRTTNKSDRIAMAREVLLSAEPLEYGVQIYYSLPTQKDDVRPEAFTRDEKLEIGGVLTGRFRSLAESGYMFSKADDDVREFIGTWNNLGDNEVVSNFLTQHIRGNPAFAVRLITILRPTVQTVGLSGTSKGDLEYSSYEYITKLVPAELLASSIQAAYGDVANMASWQESKRDEDNDLRSAQQFLWHYTHPKVKPDGEKVQ